MIFLGIDAGLDGAVAVLDDNGNVLDVFDTPTVWTENTSGKRRRKYLLAEMRAFLVKWTPATVPPSAVLEDFHALPGQSPVAAFTQGRGVGMWEGLLAGLQIPYTLVLPTRWKKVMIPDMPREDKDISRVRASQLFPKAAAYFTRKQDHDRAEAVLLAEYGRRTS